jgi:hypothetical protein
MESSKKRYKSICLEFASQEEYQEMVEDKKRFRNYLKQKSIEHKELFPEEIKCGFNFCGFVESKKQEMKMRRIKLKNNEVYQIRPSFLMPYMIAKTDEIEKALYLRRWGVPFEALAYVFGRDPMYYYRAFISMGRPNLVSTSVKQAKDLPKDLLADEKHTWINGKKLFAATTVAKACILGVDLAQSASTEGLTAAYQDFKLEAQTLDPNYKPQTVNTDGWFPTAQAWSALFPSITLILCFLHSWLKIQDRCKKVKELFPEIRKKVWHIYHSKSRSHFAQRTRRFRTWAISCVKESTVLSKILELCSNSPKFKIAFDFPNSYRTSASLDRLMNYQDRVLYSAQYFHGSLQSAKLFLRASALLWNFHPYGFRSKSDFPDRISPFSDLNGFVYHKNWLHNFLISSSFAGSRFKHKKR